MTDMTDRPKTIYPLFFEEGGMMSQGSSCHSMAQWLITHEFYVATPWHICMLKFSSTQHGTYDAQVSRPLHGNICMLKASRPIKFEWECHIIWHPHFVWSQWVVNCPNIMNSFDVQTFLDCETYELHTYFQHCEHPLQYYHMLFPIWWKTAIH